MSPRPPSRAEAALKILAPYILVVTLAGPIALFIWWRLRQSETEIVWLHPSSLLLLLAVPLLCWSSFHLERRRVGTFVFSRVHDLRASGQGLSAHLVWLPAALRIVAVGLLAVALARPQRLASERMETEGIDIMVVLDVSNSMQERDLLPNRLEAAKRVIDDFIKRREGDRLGLVLFGKEAFVQSPLTLDNRALRFLLAGVRLGLINGEMTAIGNAIGTAVNRLREPDCDKKKDEVEVARCKERLSERKKSKVIVLVTDGDNNAGQLDPHEAARLAQKIGVRVFTILIGRDSLATPAATDRFGNVISGRSRYPVNPRLLEEIADATGGVPYLATDATALEERFQAILEDLDKSKQRTQRRRWQELYPLMAWPALFLVLAEIVLSLTRLRRFP